MRNNSEIENVFMKDLTALMIRHNVIFVKNEDETLTIINETGSISIDVLDLWDENIGAEKYV